MPKKFDDMVDAIRKSLKDKNPKMDDKELDKKAYAMATTMWQKTHGGKNPSENVSPLMEGIKPYLLKEEKRDEKGRLIIAERVPVIIDGTIGVFA